ncbi:DUF4138 domain-containing protein [Algoriphagus namhaensis]
MKSIILSFILLVGTASFSDAQTIPVTWDKTTVLIFDQPIQSVDRGNRYLLSAQDDHARNVLKLKAGSKELPETNLHVLTSDGNIHAFDIIYQEQPELTTWDLRKSASAKTTIPSYGLDRSDFEELAVFLGNEFSQIIKKQNRYEVYFWLRGIYYQKGLLFFDLGAKNTSTLPFEVLGPEVKVLDAKSKKQASSREQVLKPWMDFSEIQPVLVQDQSQSLLMAFPAFTISNRKRLVFYLREKNGDRELQLTLKGKKLLEAIPLPMFHTKPTIAHGSGEL